MEHRKRAFFFQFASIAVALYIQGVTGSNALAIDFRPAGGEALVNQTTTDTQWRPDATVLVGGELVVVWSGTGGTPWLRIYNQDGSAITNEIAIDTASSVAIDSAEVAPLPGGGFIVVWQKVVLPLADYVTDVFARTFDEKGTPVSSVFRISETTEEAQVRPQVAVFPDGKLLFVWEDDNAALTYRKLRYRIYNANLTPATADGTVADNTTDEPYSSDVAILTDGTAAVVWYRREAGGVAGNDQIRMQRIASDSGAFGPTYLANINENHIDADQYVPAVSALPNGGAVVAWTSDPVFGSGDGYDSGEIFFQRFSLNSTTDELEPTGGAVQANIETTGSQLRPCLETWNNGFLVGWTSENNRRNQGDDDRPTGQDGDGAGVFARSYAFDGTPQGMPFQINATTTHHQYQISLTSLGDEIFSTWTSENQDGSFGGVYSRKLVEYIPPVDPSNGSGNLGPPSLSIGGRQTGVMKFNTQTGRSRPGKLTFLVGNSGGTPLRVQLSKTPKWLRASKSSFAVEPGQSLNLKFSLNARKLPKRKATLKKNIRLTAQNGSGSTKLKIVAKGVR